MAVGYFQAREGGEWKARRLELRKMQRAGAAPTCAHLLHANAGISFSDGTLGPS